MTTISKRIDTAIKHLFSEDYENALIQISVALDATGKKKWNSLATGARIKNFIKENEKFIYQCASKGRFILRSGAQTLINGKELKELIYESIRCSLLHGDELADHILIRPDIDFINIEQGKPVINKYFIIGLSLAVIGEPVNFDETSDPEAIFYVNGNEIFINELWGNIERIKSDLKFE